MKNTNKFKLDISIDNSDQTRVDMIYWMLDILPEFEIKRIGVIKGDNELINGLKQLPIFKDKEDPFKVLEFSDFQAPLLGEPHEYLPTVDHTMIENMS